MSELQRVPKRVHMGRRLARIGSSLVPVMLGVVVMAGCGGDSSVTVKLPPPPSPPGAMVNGTVRMPNGQVALQPGLLDRFAAVAVKEALAVTGNTQPVGQGVVVTLLRLDNQGNEIVAAGESTAPTFPTGQYHLTLPGGYTEETAGGRFQLSVGSGTTLTRALVFSTYDAVDIDFASNAAITLILAKARSQRLPLDRFTMMGIRNLVQAIRNLPGTGFGNNVEQMNNDAVAIAAADPTIQDLLNKAANIEPTDTPTLRPRVTATPTDTKVVIPPTNTPPTPPTATPPTVIQTATFTPTSPIGATLTPTLTPTIAPSATFTSTIAPTATFTVTPSATNTTLVSTSTPTDTPTTAPAGATSTPTTPPTVVTETPTSLATATPTTPVVTTATPTATPTTPAVPTASPTPTPSATPPPPTATPTGTPTPTTHIVAACGNKVVDPGEDCDVGGTCTGGDNAGTACTQEADCHGDGVCLFGPNALHACASDTDCPSSHCIHCKTFGGATIPGDATHTCAANCTFETDVLFTFVPGKVVAGGLAQGTSGAVVHGGLTLPIAFSGGQTLSIGKPIDNVIPAAIKASTVHFPPLKVGALACACVRAVSTKTCGGVLNERDGSPADDCTPDFTVGDSVCAGKKPCAYVHGVGNSATGFIGCNGLNFVNLNFSQDAGGQPLPPQPTPPVGAGPAQIGLANGCWCSANSDCGAGQTCDTTTGRCSCTLDSDCPATTSGGTPVVTSCLCPAGPAPCATPSSGTCVYFGCMHDAECAGNLKCRGGGPGAAVIVNSTAIGQTDNTKFNLPNPCVWVPKPTVAPTNTSKPKTPTPLPPNPTPTAPLELGPDHKYCNVVNGVDDDPQSSRGSPQTLPAVAGFAGAVVTNNGAPGTTVGPFFAIGGVFNCSALLAPTPSASGAGIAGAFGALNQAPLGTIVVTNVQYAQ
jgi:hypothetical protein